jgi:hypothetical protein
MSTLTPKQIARVRAERQRVKVGATVQHRDAKTPMTGRVMHHVTASVGAPSMARVEWASGASSVVPTIHLEVVPTSGPDEYELEEPDVDASPWTIDPDGVSVMNRHGSIVYAAPTPEDAREWLAER